MSVSVRLMQLSCMSPARLLPLRVYCKVRLSSISQSPDIRAER